MGIAKKHYWWNKHHEEHTGRQKNGLVRASFDLLCATKKTLVKKTRRVEEKNWAPSRMQKYVLGRPKKIRATIY